MRTSMHAVVAAAAIAALVSILAPPAVQATSNPGVLPPDSRMYGKSYAEWSAEWWRWGISMPTDRSPLMETAECNESQTGPVWFLGGSLFLSYFVSSNFKNTCLFKILLLKNVFAAI